MVNAKRGSHLWQEGVACVKELRLPVVLAEAKDVDCRKISAQACMPACLSTLVHAQ